MRRNSYYIFSSISLSFRLLFLLLALNEFCEWRNNLILRPIWMAETNLNLGFFVSFFFLFFSLLASTDFNTIKNMILSCRFFVRIFLRSSLLHKKKNHEKQKIIIKTDKILQIEKDNPIHSIIKFYYFCCVSFWCWQPNKIRIYEQISFA